MNIDRWLCLDTGAHGAAWNMACDETLMRTMGVGRCAVGGGKSSKLRAQSPLPILRIYTWQRPTISIGCFQKWFPELAGGRALVRRPTGGGLVEHGDGFTYSLLLPRMHPLAALPTLELYRSIHEAVRCALLAMGKKAKIAFARPKLTAQSPKRIARCFVAPVCCDLVVASRKIAGAAIRKTKEGTLIQGEVKADLNRSTLLRATAARFGARFEELELSAKLETEIRKLARTKYASEAWTKRF